MAEIVSQGTTPFPDPSRLESLVVQTLEEARALGATATEAAVSFSNALTVTVRLGDVETLEHQRDRSLGVTVYFGQRKGSASTSDWSPAAIRSTVGAACAIARHTAADPCAGLAEPERLARQIPDLDLYHPWALSVEEAIAIAKTCEAAALTYDLRIRNSEGSSVSSRSRWAVYGNSNGFLGGYPSTRHSVGCSVIGQDNGGMQRDYWHTAARHQMGLEPPEAVGRQAAIRTVQRLNGQCLSTRQAPVLFTPEAARGVFGHFISAIGGGALYRKASFLLDRLGEQIFPAALNIREQPHLPRALGSAPFDGEGVETSERDLIRAGILQGYVLDSYSARRLGMQTTGNAGGVHNVTVEAGALDYAALLREMDTGLVVTHLMGHGVNLVTGDYSRGAAGFWVEGGEIRYPVEEITIAGQLGNMLSSIVAVGNDMDTRGNIRCGSVLIERMTIGGK